MKHGNKGVLSCRAASFPVETNSASCLAFGGCLVIPLTSRDDGCFVSLFVSHHPYTFPVVHETLRDFFFTSFPFLRFIQRHQSVFKLVVAPTVNLSNLDVYICASHHTIVLFLVFVGLFDSAFPHFADHAALAHFSALFCSARRPIGPLMAH